MFRDIPPVGGRTVWRSDASTPAFDGYTPIFVDSGTSALALALVAARLRARVEAPEVILPAYGCPDLVAAAIYAGCKPVLVDIASPEDPAICLDALTQVVGENTAAVVAVNFMGVRERLVEIKACLPKHVLLIEDNAQWYPELDEGVELLGDLTVNSFGRGKPASILGGGMLLIKESLLDFVQTDVHKLIADSGKGGGFKQRLTTALYNQLLNPFCYFWLNRNPLLNIGATHYEPLEEVRAMPVSDVSRLGANIAQYVSQPRSVEFAFDELVGKAAGLASPGLGDSARRCRLLRYPLVVGSVGQAARLMKDLRAYGVTRMYQRPLHTIDGVAQDVRVFNKTPNAIDFAARFITLPVHSGVTASALAFMLSKLKM